jgi:hypothetical protein
MFTRSLRLYHFFFLVLGTLCLAKGVTAVTCSATNISGIGNVASLIACIDAANIATTDTIIDLGGASFTLTGSTLYPA